MNDHIPRDILPAYPRRLSPDQVRTKLLELLGLEGVPTEVDLETHSTREEEGLRLTSLTYSNSLGEAVPGILAMPLSAERNSLAGVVCVPGTGGSADQISDRLFHSDQPGAGPLVGWGRELARRGFATLSISPKGSDDRRGGRERWSTEAKLLAPYGRTQMGVLVDEALRAGRILATTEQVYPERIGLTGISLGGNATWYGMACAPWIRAAAPVCGGLGSMASVIHEGDVQRHSAYYFIPHMLRYFDHPEIVAECIAPRPFMMVAPTMDEDMPSAGVDMLIKAVGPAYETLGHPERFKVYRPEVNHVYLPQHFEWVARWFQRFL